MGQRGPLKGSSRFGVVKGGKSTGSTTKPDKPRTKRLTVPKSLPPEARKLLRKILPELEEMLADIGGLKDGDMAGLTALALHYAIMDLAAKQLAGDDGKFSILVEDPDHPSEGGKPAVRKHPLLSVIANHSEKLMAWAQQYAYTPAARVRLNIKPPKAVSNLEKFLAGKKY